MHSHSGLSDMQYNHSCLFAATYCSQPGQHFRGLLGHFTLDMIQKIDCLFPSQVEHYPWTALIDPPWAETIQHVDAAWCAGDACQDMDPSAASRPHFTPVVTPDKTPNPRAEQECHRYASCNEPSPSLSTHYTSATTDAPPASGDLTTLTYWLTLFICFSRFSISPRAIDYVAFTLVFVLPCLVLPFRVGLLACY